MKNIKVVLSAIILTLVVFTTNSSCSRDKRLGDVFSEMKMPYVALNMTLGTRIIITNDREYLKELEKKSGMSRKQIRELFKYLQENPTRDEIRKNACDEISKSLKEFQNLPDNKKLNFYVINLLAPYLTMIVNNFNVNDTDGEEIQSIFAKLFNIPQNQANPLFELVEGTRHYRRGGIFRSSHTHELNDYLGKKGFHLDYGLRRSYANIFKIEYVICKGKEWRPGENISIFVLRQIYPNFLESKLGYAPAGSSDVFIIKDLHYNLAKKYKNELRKKTPRIPFSDRGSQQLWNSLGLDIDHLKANRILYELAYKDLSGGSLSQIERNLIIQTAIHEAKHRIDEIEMPEMRLNLDLEVSAYLTTAIFGIYPFIGLRDLIEWTEGYYRNTRYTKLGNLLVELWALADKSLKQDDAEKFLRAKLRKIYENYTTIQGNDNLINQNEFEQRMLPLLMSGLSSSIPPPDPRPSQPLSLSR
ncbi:MAG: hypothetical protein LBC70_10990 [Chitinispirillales bacterium]|jgi:hypothetical protein|nr:hypothetical protein [Chitinispirillales bacterium]